MNYETARSTLAGAILDALMPYPTLPVFWDNVDNMDLSKAGPLCLLIEFYWDDAAQLDISQTPLHRTAGSVYFTIFSHEGTGTKGALQLADTLTTALKFKNITGLVTRVAAPGRRAKRNGWQSQELHLPFYFDSTP